eukprot:2745549-Prymnesium_polylepis.1
MPPCRCPRALPSGSAAASRARRAPAPLRQLAPKSAHAAPLRSLYRCLCVRPHGEHNRRPLPLQPTKHAVVASAVRLRLRLRLYMSRHSSSKSPADCPVG